MKRACLQNKNRYENNFVRIPSDLKKSNYSLTKLKFLLLFLLAVSFSILVNAQKKPYNNLLITEAMFCDEAQNYVEFTNMGIETIDLSEFEFGTISPWDIPWTPIPNGHFMLPKKMLSPGKSFVIAVGSDFEPENWLKDPLHNKERIMKPEFYKLTDMILHRQELNTNKNDSITPNWRTMNLNNGRDCWYLRHHYLNAITNLPDSMLVDQVGGIFDEANGTSADMAHDVAGVKNATNNSILIRKNSVKTGITEFSSTNANAEAAEMQFSNNRGLDFTDSEWIPVPILEWNRPWRAVFWTVGNQGDYKLDVNTLVSKTGKVKVDLNNGTITVPWGIRNDDSLMYQFERKPGLAWKYDYAPTVNDSAYNTARTGDKLTLYVCGNEATIKKFNIIALDPTTSDNIVIPKNGFNYTSKIYGRYIQTYSGIQVTDGVTGMDTISHINFATRLDTLFKYLEKAPKASWKIVFKDGVKKPDLKNADLLRVTSENGTVKDYFLKLEKFVPNPNAFLSSITWPDIPSYFKGDIAGYFGWKGDTIPGFTPSVNNYVVNIPFQFQGIPALMFAKQQTDSKVEVNRAKTLDGTIADRSVTFTVTAENDTTINVYTVRFDKEKDPAIIQGYIGEPFFSQYIFGEQWANAFLEIANPGTEPMDLSSYMIVSGWGTPADVFGYGTGLTEWADAYYRYVPGKKWQDQANWLVQPCILEPDLATNAIVYPGGVFVIANVRSAKFNDILHGNGDSEYRKEFDIDFQKNPWGRTVANQNAISCGPEATIYMYKILNESVKNGLKPATDPYDFELIETWGTGGAVTTVKVGGIPETYIQSNFRKPNVYKGNPVVGGSNGTTMEDSEWYVKDQAYYDALNYAWPENILRICDGLGSHEMDEVTIQKSTVTSPVYIVSPGFTKKETIKGLTTGTTVTGFYFNILIANAKQTLTVKSAVNGNILAEAAAISKGDTLIVLSADSVNTTKYILDVSDNGFGSSNALLTSTKYIIDVTGTTGTISGSDFKQGTFLKTVFDGVVVPSGATITITDANDAYMSLIKLNYDTAYVNVIATDKIYFEVIAENGTSKILYQLMPTSNPGDAYVTSDVYSVDQLVSVIQYIPGGTSVHSLLSNVYPAPGATVEIFDKAGFVRDMGDIYKDDKLMVTSADGKSTKAYYFSMLSFHRDPAYVVSDEYQIDQVKYSIFGPKTNTSLAEFVAKLYPSFGATMKVLDKDGVEITGNLSKGAKLVVTAADGLTIATYNIDVQFPDVALAPVAESIKMYPNPTTDRVVINGLAKGNRVQVFNAVGVTLRDVIVENSTDYVSLSAQPAGIYIFVISSGDQHINIQKIVKK